MVSYTPNAEASIDVEGPYVTVPPYTLVLRGPTLAYALRCVDRWGSGAPIADQVIGALRTAKLFGSASWSRGREVLTQEGHRLLTQLGGPFPPDVGRADLQTVRKG